MRDTIARWQKLRPAPGFDLILIAGNVTRDGSAGAFERATRLFGELRGGIGARGAVVLAVPGERDVSGEGEGSGVAERGAEATYAAWRTWWRAQLEAMPVHAVVREGEAPGDFSATVTLAERDIRVGVVGLDTVNGRADDDAQTPLRLGERLRAVCGSDPAAWARHHHIAVLLTRHAPVREEGAPTRWAGLADAGLRLHHASRESSRRVGFESFGGDADVVSAWSFAGYSVEGVAGMHRIRPQGGVVTLLDLSDRPFARLLATEHDTAPGSTRKPDVVARDEWVSAPSDELPEGLPAPYAPTVVPDTTRPLTQEEVADLLWEVLPSESDFRGFTFSEMRDAHRALPQDASREVRIKRLLAMRTPAQVLDALRSYLPDTTAARERELRARR